MYVCMAVFHIISCTRLSYAENPQHEENHKILQPALFFLLIPPLRLLDELPFDSLPTATVTASSNTSSTPVISLLLHSMYWAPIRSATAAPCSGVTGVRPWVLRRSIQVRFVRRSDLRPTRIRGVSGQKWRTSGYHYGEGLVSILWYL
jgi:hypothetical protein